MGGFVFVQLAKVDVVLAGILSNSFQNLLAKVLPCNSVMGPFLYNIDIVDLYNVLINSEKMLRMHAQIAFLLTEESN